MNQPAFDFGDELDDAANPTYTVSELADAVNQQLRRGFSDGVWVRGEIREWNERGGHAYFTLADDAPGRQAVVRVQLFANARLRLRPLLAKHRLRLTVGMKVRIFGHLDFYAPSGQLGLKMSDLDPRFTLGDLAQQRDQVLRRLAADGSLDANGRRPLSRVPLRVGVVSSAGTAAWHDFHDELLRSGFGFQVALADTRVQGPEAARRVTRPCRRCPGTPSSDGLDVIVVIRGGGSRNELATFDAETDRPGDRRGARCRCSPGWATRSTAASPTRSPTRRGRRRRRAPAPSSRPSPATSPRPRSATRPSAGRPAPASTRPTAPSPSRPTASPAAPTPPSSAPTNASACASTGSATVPPVRSTPAPSTSTWRLQRLVARVPAVLDGETRHLAGLEARVRGLDPVNVLARGWSITRAADGRVVRDPARRRRGRRPHDAARRRYRAQPSRAGGRPVTDEPATGRAGVRPGARRARRASSASWRAPTSTSTAWPTAWPGPPS